MNTNDNPPRDDQVRNVIELAGLTSQIGGAAVPPNDLSVGSSRLSEFRPSLIMGAALIVSGFFHLALLWCTGASWEGALSLRKPGLFGVSAGVTVWSIAWVLTRLKPFRHDRGLATLMSGGLLLEVGLITMQHWRGVSSHFNRATPLDAAVESAMLGLILLVTVGIAVLCVRSRQLRPVSESQAIAIRAGLWLLLFSCGLGLMTTILGEVNLANGRSPGIWGHAGVLKYPHGAALHAIQTLPLLAGLLNWLRVANAGWHLRAAAGSHVLFLTHALWQTLSGRARIDVDLIGGATLVAAGLLVLMPLSAIAWGTVAKAVAFWSESPTVKQSR